MFPDEFDYYRATTLEEAFDLLEEHADELPKILSGGHSLLPMMKSGLANPSVIVDIGGIDDLRGISVSDGTIEIGALTTYAEIAEHEDVKTGASALAEAAGEIGDIQVRNRGTIGGNLAHADPASDPPAVMRALDGTLIAAGPDGERRIDADDFFIGMYTTDLEENELVIGIDVPVADKRTTSAYTKRANIASGYAVVGVAAQLTVAEDGNAIESARVAANGALDYPIRLEPVETALTGEKATDETVREAAARACDDLDVDLLMEDDEASKGYRAKLLEVYTERAVLAAREGQ